MKKDNRYTLPEEDAKQEAIAFYGSIVVLAIACILIVLGVI